MLTEGEAIQSPEREKCTRSYLYKMSGTRDTCYNNEVANKGEHADLNT